MSTSRPLIAVALAASVVLVAPPPPGFAEPDAPAPLTLCLAAHADDSAVYPIDEVPANHRAMCIVFRLKGTESYTKLTHVWTAVDVGAAAPKNHEIDRADLALTGRKRGVLRYRHPKDLPVGAYRLDVLADGKPWASLAIPVVGGKPVAPAPKPADLLPLAVGTTWTYAFVIEAGPVVKKMTPVGAERGADGKWRATTTHTVAAVDESGARVEMRRNGTLMNEQWWRLDANGLGITRERVGEAEALYDPPVPLLRLPLEPAASFTYKPSDGSFERAYRTWGPLSVVGPNGPTPGWVVFYTQAIPRGTRTFESHFVPGVGIVREVAVDAVGGLLRTRIETTIAPAK